MSSHTSTASRLSRKASPPESTETNFVLSVQPAQEGPLTLSDSDEELTNRPLDPGDVMYRGKVSTSCVVTAPDLDSSPPRTRGRARAKKRTLDSADVQLVSQNPRKRGHQQGPPDTNVSPLTKKPKGLPEATPQNRLTASMLIDDEAQADSSGLSDLEDTDMDEDDIAFIDDGPLPADPQDLYAAPLIRTTHSPSPSALSPPGDLSSTAAALPPASAAPVLSAQSVTSARIDNPSTAGLLSPLTLPDNQGQLDAVLRNAMQNKDFLMALLRSVSNDSIDPQSGFAERQQSAWQSAAAHHARFPPSPSPLPSTSLITPLSPSLTSTPPPRIPETPTKPKRSIKQKVRGKGKGKAPPVLQHRKSSPINLSASVANPPVAASSISSLPPITPATTSSTVPSPTSPPLTTVGSPSISPMAPSIPALSFPGIPVGSSAGSHSQSALVPATPVTPSPGSQLAGNPQQLTPLQSGPVTPLSTTTGVRMSMRDLAQLLPAGYVAPGEPNAAPGSTSSIRLCPPLPQKCEVNDPALHDPLLADTYQGLVNLKQGRFSSWSSNIGRGQVVFSTWVSKTPSMNTVTAYSIITFTHSRRWINGSRLSPLEVELREIRHNNTLRYNVYRGSVPAIAMSCGYLWDSHLTAPKPYGLSQKMVSIVLHKQEWERLVAFCCMIFNVNVIAAQVSQSALQFSTRSDWNPNAGDHKSSPAPSPSPNDDDHMFSHTPSPAVEVSVPMANQTETMALSANSTIPVYDARDTNFNFQNDIENLESLPRWEGEIPRGSFVVVGYTLAAYFPNQKWNLATNVRWVVLVGIPE